MKGKLLIVAIILIVIALVFNHYYQYRERNLADVLKMDKVEKVHYVVKPLEDGKHDYNRTLSDKESIQELTDFLSQYQVKKRKDKGWTTTYTREQFQFFLDYGEGENLDRIMVERDVVLGIYNKLNVLNAPVDYKWFEEFVGNREMR